MSASLAARGAPTELVVWAEPHRADWAAAWQACPRGDWLLGIAERMGVPRAEVAHAAIDVARFGLEDVGAGALPVEDALEQATSALGTGEPAALGALDAVADAFHDASESERDRSVSASLRAVACALRACSRPGEAASVPALVAEAAVLAAGECAMSAVLGYAQRRCADIVRARISAAQIVAHVGA